MKKCFLFAVLLLVTAAMSAQNIMDRDSSYRVQVSPRIQHGSLLVQPSGMVEAGQTVSINPVPDNGYELYDITVSKLDNPDEIVPVVPSPASGNYVFTMPRFDVFVDATFTQPGGNGPIISGDIATPAAICAGSSLTLTAPQVINATQTQWQISADKNFTSYEVYTNQTLDRSYNGWKLRFMASNSAGTVYSNTVTITVNNLGNLSLTGDLSACTRAESNYTVTGASNANYSWEVTDNNATINGSGKSVTILWGTAGRQTVTVTVDDPKIGCSETLEMQVAVQSFVDERDLNNLVAKKHDGKDYMLIYPNPKDTHYRYQWFKDGNPIQGATLQYYYPQNGLEAGEYEVYVSFNADANGNLICGAFSPAYTVTTARAEFLVQPNPSHTGQDLVLNTDLEGEALLSVFTLDGKRVLQQTVSGSQPTVQLNLPQGMYFVRLSQGADEDQITKIVIQ